MTGALALALVVTFSPEGLTGRWVLEQDPVSRDALEAAVSDLCARLDPLTRSLGCGQVRERNQPYEQLRLELDARAVRFTFGPWGPVTARFGEPPRAVRNHRDERVEVSARLAPAGLECRLAVPVGVRRDSLALVDGDRLVLSTVVDSPFFPVPLRYALTYRRVP